jgi:hypothetical protein
MATAQAGEEDARVDGAAMVQAQGQAQGSLLQAVAAWPANISRALHWTALPDLKMPSNGRLWVTLFLRAVAKDREAATTDVLESYFRLKPLLPVFFRHLSFAPVEDVETLRQRLAPFEAAGAVEIGRQQKRIELGKPVEHTSLGFGPLKIGHRAAAQLLRLLQDVRGQSEPAAVQLPVPSPGPRRPARPGRCHPGAIAAALRHFGHAGGRPAGAASQGTQIKWVKAPNSWLDLVPGQ